MKNWIFFACFCLMAGAAFAKKVKFSVNMAGRTLSPNGIHVSGDFQELAGFQGGNWNSATTALSQEGSSTIYSRVVDLPAFRKYEFKYVNGDQFYEVEFVPELSRVGHDFNDNRWIYVDSLSPDTFQTGALLFGGNAPAGLMLLRLQAELPASSAVEPLFVKGPFNNFQYERGPLYSFVDRLYEGKLFLSAGEVEYRFSMVSFFIEQPEQVPQTCANSQGNRALLLASDTLAPLVCFASCSPCQVTRVLGQAAPDIRIVPNPGKGMGNLKAELGTRVSVYDGRGVKVLNFVMTQNNYSIPALPAGLYTFRIAHATSTVSLRYVSE